MQSIIKEVKDKSEIKGIKGYKLIVIMKTVFNRYLLK